MSMGNGLDKINFEDGLLVKGKVKPKSSGKELIPSSKDKPKHNKSTKISDNQQEKMDKLKIVLGTKNESAIIRWCIDRAWEFKGTNIERICQEIEKINKDTKE